MNTSILRTLLALSGLLLSLSPLSAAVNKVLFIGNSITRSSPAPERLGWNGDWGMAASAREKDWVHLFLARLGETQGGKIPDHKISAEGGGKITDRLQWLQDYQAYGADLAIIQLGENDNKDVGEETFQKPYDQLVAAVRAANPAVRIYCFGVWSPPNGNAFKDRMIRAVADKYGAVFVDLTSQNFDPRNKAASENRFTHQGVNWHPGDAGMKAYADALWTAYTSASAPAPAAAASVVPDWSADETWAGSGELVWNPPVSVEKNGNNRAMVVRKPAVAGRVVHAAKLPADLCAGRVLTIKTRVKADAVSAKPNTWNGIKLSLRMQNAEAAIDYPQYHLPTGTYDWREVSWIVNVPDNIVDLQLVLGLEEVSGAVWFAPFEITAVARR